MVVLDKVYTRTGGEIGLGMCADRVILRGVIKCFSKCGSCQN